VPNTADGDFTVTGDPEGEATRVNKDGLIETVAADVPRLNYDPSNPQDPHLLLEPTRTNQFTNSEDLSYIDYKNPSGIITDDIISPNGSLTADKALQSTGDYFRETVSVTNGTTYSFSVFLKKGDLRYAIIRSLFSQNGTTPANSNNVFDLDNGSVIYTGTDIVNASIEAYTNDWYRCSFVSLASGTSSASFIDFYFTSSSSSTQASGTAGSGYAWGMQLEQGSYPTSYIPTTAAVTRTQDRCFNGGDANLFNDSEGVLFVDLEALGEGTTTRKISLSNGNTSFVNFNFNATSGKVSFEFGSTLNSFYILNSTGHTLTNRNKIAIKYKSGDTDCFINGTRVTGNNGTFSLSGLDRVNFENRATNGSQNMFAKIHQLMVFNEVLSDSELETLTS
jgi:hypothetical protein